MMNRTIFLTHTAEDLRRFYDDAALEALRAEGRIVFNPSTEHLSPRELLEAARGCQVIISEWGTGADREFFARADDLVAFVRCGVEMRNVDIDAASENGILVVNTPGLYVSPVVELVVAFMVCLARNIVNRCVMLRAGETSPDRFGTELRGKTLGLVGYGDIARRLSSVAQTLEMRVLFSDPYVPTGTSGATRVDLPQLLEESDFVSLHAKWTKDTEGMMGEAAFRRMKPTAYFINTARGALVQEAALLKALTECWIAGAALDVFANEPDIVGNPLLALPNVIATPHIGGVTPETMTAQAARTVEIVREIFRSAIPAGTVNGSALIHPRVHGRAPEV
jgi:D-3-phosphoglycerate dehydrogenase